MGDPLKLILSNSIKTLEQGAFQEFCLSFLPTYDKRFRGLVRFGGTADGKTRPGTPDLHKVLPDGEQVAVQCSVEKDYWKQPKAASIESWKPCSDILKCLKHMDNLREIVLCSTQEVPTNCPNAEAQVAEFAKSRASARITILTGPNFEEELLSNLTKYQTVIKRCLPQFATCLQGVELGRPPNAAEITLDIYRKHSAALDDVANIVEGAIKAAPDGVDPGKIAIQMATGLRSRFERSQLTPSPPIQRISGKQYFGTNLPGHIYSLFGVPKIGKTSFIAQVCSELDRSEIEILWFDPPILEVEQDEFCRDLSRAILSRLASPKTANEFADKKLSLDTLLNRLLTESVNKSVQIIIDDAQHLTSSVLSKIDGFIKTIKRSPAKANFGIIFISNKTLKGQISQLEKEYSSPAWNEGELVRLLQHNKIEIEGSLEDYTKVLINFSGGHPLVAIALARKAPSIQGLLLSGLVKKPALHDEDLTEEVKRLLFKERLKDPNLRDFVLRIAVLVYPAKPSILNFISTQISPPLRTPHTLMLDELEGSVIEGDAKRGFQISFVFRAVATLQVTDAKRKEIFEGISQFLLTPKNKVINAEETIEGITYAILSENLRRAFAWTSLLLLETPKLRKNQIRFLLDRLFLIESLNMPKSPPLRISYQLALWQMATAYSKLGRHKTASDILRRILSHKLQASEAPSDLPMPIGQLYASLTLYLVLQLALLQDFVLALATLDEIDLTEVPKGSPRKLLCELTADLVARGAPTQFPKSVLYALVKSATPMDTELIDHLEKCFVNLGLRYAQEGSTVDLTELLAAYDDSPPVLWHLLSHMTHAEIQLERGESHEAIEMVDDILQEASESGFVCNNFTAKLLQMKGDAFYRMEKDQEALQNYQGALELLPKDQILFDHAWAHYRIGICTANLEEAIARLSDASSYFDSLGYKTKKAECEGERGIALYHIGRISESVLAFEGLVRQYYQQGSAEYAPAATIALALVGRLQSELEKKPLPTDASGKLIYPSFERGIFGKVQKDARPNPGSCSAFYTIGKVYDLLGNKDRKIELFRLSLAGTLKMDIDNYSRLLAGLELIYELILVRALKEVSGILRNLFGSTTGLEFKSEDYWVSATLTRTEGVLKEGRVTKEDYSELLDIFEDATKLLSGKRKFWWLSEIHKRKGGIDGVTPKSELKPNYLVRALAHSKESENYTVLFEVSQCMGFTNPSLSKSIKGLAQVQSLLILAICNDGGEIERLQTVGSNLMNIWSVLEYRRLSEDDLPYWRALHDNAVDLEKKMVPPDLRPPLMVLLLLSATKVTKEEKFTKAVDWAYSLISGRWDKVPPETRRYLER